MPLPDQSPRGGIANLINRFENKAQRSASSQSGPISVSSRSSSVVSNTSSVGDGLKEEAKEKREWPPKTLQQQSTGEKPAFVMPSYLRPKVNELASTVATSLSARSSSAAGGPAGMGVAKDPADESVDTPKTATPNGGGTPTPPQVAPSTSTSSIKSDSSSSAKASRADIAPVDTSPPVVSQKDAVAAEEAEVEPHTPKPGEGGPLNRKASTLTVRPPPPSAPAKASGKTPATAKPPATARPAPAAKAPAAKPAPTSFKAPSSATAAAAGTATPKKTLTPATSTASLKPQHTGGSVTSTTGSTARKPASKPTPSTPSRAKTPSKPKPTPSASRAKSPVARAKTPSTGLYAPTAASLAKARNAPPVPQSTAPKKVLSSEAADRLMRPTAASLSKARTPTTTAQATASPRPSFGGGPGTPVKKSATAGGTPLKAATTPIRKTVSASPAVKKSPGGAVKKGAVGAAAVAGVGASALAASASTEESADEQQEPAATSEAEEPPAPEPESEVESEAAKEPEAPATPPPASEDEAEPPASGPAELEDQEPLQEATNIGNGAKVGTDLEDIVNMLEFVPASKIAQQQNGSGAIQAEEVHAEIPDEASD